MIKRIGCCHLCGNRPILEIPLKNGVDFGHTPDLPNEAAQWATIYGIMNPTHRRSHQGILVTLLNNSWLHLLGDPTGPSVKSNYINGFWSLCQVVSTVQKSFSKTSTILIRIINEYFTMTSRLLA